MEGQSSLIYSYTDGGIIAAKLNHRENDTNYIRMGISFPLDREKYKSTFKPTEDYVSHRILEKLLDLSEIVDEDRKFKIRKTNVCYGNSIRMIDNKEGKGIVGMFVMNEPINESSLLNLEGLTNVCDSLSKKYQEVSLFKDADTYLSATMNSGSVSNNFISQLNLLDIKIPKESLGCRLELILPAEQYETAKIERPFNDVSNYVGFGKKLQELEKLHEDFLNLKDSFREKSRVVTTVKV